MGFNRINEAREDGGLQGQATARVGVGLNPELDGVPASLADQVVRFEELLRVGYRQAGIEVRERPRHVGRVGDRRVRIGAGVRVVERELDAVPDLVGDGLVQVVRLRDHRRLVTGSAIEVRGACDRCETGVREEVVERPDLACSL